MVTLPLMVPSSATRRVPEPEPGTLSGGTSSLPLSLTFIAPLPGIHAGAFSRYVEQAARVKAAAMATTSFTISLFMDSS